MSDLSLGYEMLRARRNDHLGWEHEKLRPVISKDGVEVVPMVRRVQYERSLTLHYTEGPCAKPHSHWVPCEDNL
jgi:hypothetical protein